MFFSLVVELSGKVVVGDDLFFGVCVLLVCLVRTRESGPERMREVAGNGGRRRLEIANL